MDDGTPPISPLEGRKISRQNVAGRDQGQGRLSAIMFGALCPYMPNRSCTEACQPLMVPCRSPSWSSTLSRLRPFVKSSVYRDERRSYPQLDRTEREGSIMDEWSTSTIWFSSYIAGMILTLLMPKLFSEPARVEAKQDDVIRVFSYDRSAGKVTLADVVCCERSREDLSLQPCCASSV